VFTQTGIYELTFKASAVLNGQRIYSDPYTYYFGVQTAVPEPATMLTLGGAALLALRRRRKA
jgi:surface-anchored protein